VSAAGQPARVRTSQQHQGDAAEDLVARRLEGAGWSILARQLHVGRAELDIVAVDPGPPRQLVIVEVRRRGRRDFGVAEETVDHRKRTRLHQAAWRWLERADAPRLPVRFDLIVVEPSPDGQSAPVVRHHRAAF
jgi:putative endonuclease